MLSCHLQKTVVSDYSKKTELVALRKQKASFTLTKFFLILKFSKSDASLAKKTANCK
jgi:hypothetical protein